MDDDTLAIWRYCFQRVLVPCVVIIGVLGNIVSVIVLTRRRMRCSTNIYLTALAIADIVFLSFIFILSLEHYPNIHASKYVLYWRTFGLSHWFCDASSYTSIYLTVSFTIERYIAVCHPIKGQILCTESRAKKVIAVVGVLCFLITISTAFEHQLSTKTKYVDNFSGALCKENDENINSTQMNQFNGNSDNKNNKIFQKMNTSDILDQISYDHDSDDYYNENNNYEKMKMKRALVTSHDVANDDDDDDIVNAEFLKAVNTTGYEDNQEFNNTEMMNESSRCHYEYFLYATPSALGYNEIYKAVFYPMTSILFVFLPLILLATFNCFLVAAVHRSHKMRHRMTNTRQSDTKTSQENKITIILIAVVALFLICQTPTAIQLILTGQPQEAMDHRTENLHKARGNLMNFLVTMNAACNFLLYCALSDKYRQTVRTLLFRKKPQRQHTVSSSRFSRYASRGGMERSSFRNIDTSKDTTFTTVSTTPPRDSLVPMFSFTPKKSVSPQFSLSSTTECQHHLDNNNLSENPSRKNSSVSNASNTQRNNNEVNNRSLKSSISQTSLTRSHSLNSRPTVKHSPDCKSNVNKF